LVLVRVVFGDLSLRNRTVNPVVRSELLTGNVAVIEPRPSLEHGRAMITDAAQARLDNFLFTAPEAAVQIPRQALLLNDNLLERVPKLDGDRKSTRLNSSHGSSSYAVFCLKKNTRFSGRTSKPSTTARRQENCASPVA